jgi:hypothetical protein
LARQGVQVVMHNTLDASDYGLLDENTLRPRPNYWAALLWHDLMGTTVLDSGVPIHAGLHVYAHALKAVPGGTAVLVIDTSRTQPQSIAFPQASDRYTLAATAAGELDQNVELNGTTLALRTDGGLPDRKPVAQPSGIAEFAPETITFLAFAGATNPACK